MNNVNSVTIRGQVLTVERKEPPGGYRITILRVATNIKVIRINGEEMNDHQEHVVACWGELANQAYDLKPGEHVSVTGRLQYNSYGTRVVAATITRS